ncbi:hypothetical protein Hamer_G023961 [Homarus americanus]|uniref:Uncharacterized protein n=1 Tax=Homarus americanus TaxID=6706 RepID=A0A8J5JXX8_HOMAM|nr:hypothetical protein Hamer_G023961 [Homarus americanus]
MENQKFVVKSCCCGCTLRTASIIIAVFSLVYGLASAGYSISLGVTGLNEAWLDLVINIYNVIFTIILMHGIRKDHHRLIMAWHCPQHHPGHLWCVTKMLLVNGDDDDGKRKRKRKRKWGRGGTGQWKQQ